MLWRKSTLILKHKEWFPYHHLISQHISTTKGCWCSNTDLYMFVLFQDMWQVEGNYRGTELSTHSLPGWMKKMCLNERPIKVSIMCQHKDLLYNPSTFKSSGVMFLGGHPQWFDLIYIYKYFYLRQLKLINI